MTRTEYLISTPYQTKFANPCVRTKSKQPERPVFGQPSLLSPAPEHALGSFSLPGLPSPELKALSFFPLPGFCTCCSLCLESSAFSSFCDWLILCFRSRFQCYPIVLMSISHSVPALFIPFLPSTVITLLTCLWDYCVPLLHHGTHSTWAGALPVLLTALCGHVLGFSKHLPNVKMCLES